MDNKRTLKLFSLNEYKEFIWCVFGYTTTNIKQLFKPFVHRAENCLHMLCPRLEHRF